MNAAKQETGGALRRASGRDRDEWFAELDDWGALGRPYREIAGWLTGQGLSAWWAQKIIVEYEQAHGVRAPGVRRDGTFAATASKTIGASVQRAFEAFAEPQLRARWLPGVDMSERGSTARRSARFDLTDGTRLNVAFAAKGEARAQVAVEQTHLADATAAAEAKVLWRSRLTALKELLEG